MYAQPRTTVLQVTHSCLWLARQGDANCTVWSVIHWRARSAWKALPAATLNKVQAAFVAAYGGDPAPVELPTAEGYDVVNSTGPCVHDSAPAVVEMLQFNLPCANVSAFVRADHQVRAPNAP